MTSRQPAVLVARYSVSLCQSIKRQGQNSDINPMDFNVAEISLTLNQYNQQKKLFVNCLMINVFMNYYIGLYDNTECIS